MRFQVPLLVVFAASGVWAQGLRKGRVYALVPGVSMGDVLLGEARSHLQKKGFLKSEGRDPDQFLQKDDLLVRFEKGQAVQIWYVGKDLSQLQWHGARLPKTGDLKKLKALFKDCEPDQPGSGGVLAFCEGRGIELVFSYLGEAAGSAISVSVLSRSASNSSR